MLVDKKLNGGLKVLILSDSEDNGQKIEKYFVGNTSYTLDIHHSNTLGYADIQPIDKQYDTIICDFLHNPSELKYNQIKDNLSTTPTIWFLDEDNYSVQNKLINLSSINTIHKSDLENGMFDRFLTRVLESKEIDQHLLDLMNRSMQFLDSIPNFMLIANLKGKIVYVNRSIIGKEEMVGKIYYDLFQNKFHEIIKNSFNQTVIEKCFKECEAIGLISERWYKIKTGPIFDNNILIGISLTAIDIHNQKILEEHLKLLQGPEFLGTLVSGIVHDINNLLTGITASISAIKALSTNFTEEQIEFLSQAESSGFLASEILTQLKLTSTAKETKIENIDLYDVTLSVVKLLKETTDKRILKIINFEPGQFLINARYSDLHQIILNLSVNSIQAIEEKGITNNNMFTVSVKNVQKEDENQILHEYLQIIVEDTGCGISEVSKSKIFEPWYTTKSSQHQKGQGLGLAIVKKLVVDTYKGAITIDSIPFEGTKFNVFLQSMETELEQIKPEKPKILPRKGSELILIIEDQKSIRKVITRYLKLNDYNVISAEDGIEGIDLFRNNASEIDLVILDLSLPKISGYDVYEEICRIKPNCKVIISSGCFQDEVKMDFSKDNLLFLQKPYTVDQLSEELTYIFEKKDSNQTSLMR